MLSVVIANKNYENAKTTKNTLKKCGIDVKGIAIDDKQTYSMIKMFNPSVVLLESNIEKHERTNIVKYVEQDTEIYLKPKFFVLTHLTDSIILEDKFGERNSVMMIKAEDEVLLPNGIERLLKEKEEEKLDTDEVSRVLFGLGISASLKGHRYITEALKIAFENEESIYSITKNIYPEIAKKYSTTVASVERAIRNAIEVSWKKANQGEKEIIFGNTIDPAKGRPTNHEMIAHLFEWLKTKHKQLS